MGLKLTAVRNKMKKFPLQERFAFISSISCIFNERHYLCEKEDNFITTYQENIILSCVVIEIIEL